MNFVKKVVGLEHDSSLRKSFDLEKASLKDMCASLEKANMRYNVCSSQLDTIEPEGDSHEVIEKMGTTNHTYHHVVTKSNGDKMSQCRTAITAYEFK